MKKLTSKRGIPIPRLYFVTDVSEISSIPKGVPYFYGAPHVEDALVEILEYEVLFQKAIASGLPLNFKQILEREGYRGIEHGSKRGLDVCTSIGLNDGQDIKTNQLRHNKSDFSQIVRDGNFYVDIGLIKNLNIFPTWMTVLEEAISANIHKFATFDTNMYNKKLEGMYGGIRLESPSRNLIIIDISGSIPRSISKTILVLAQNMALAFYADLMITGSTTTLYEYERIGELDTRRVYDENDTDNDQTNFLKIITESEKKYSSLIVFGDEDYPGHQWNNSKQDYSTLRTIGYNEGRKLNKWKVDQIINFHVDEGRYNRYLTNEDGSLNWGSDGKVKDRVAGYGIWFNKDGNEVVHIEKWVRDLAE